MSVSALLIVTILNSSMVSVLTLFGPSTNKFATWPAWLRALVTTLLTCGAAITKSELDTGALWDPSMLVIGTTGIAGLLKVLIEALDSTSSATKSVKAILRRSGIGVVCLCFLPLVGCTGAGPITCAVIHAADVACPYVLVQLPDGGTEAIPKDGLVRQAEAQRRARLSVDGGAQ